MHPVFDHRKKGTLKVCPWLCGIYFKDHAGYPCETWPPSSIIELSTCPVFDHCEKGTFKVYPWLPRMLFKGHMGYPQETLPLFSIFESCPRLVSSWKMNFQSLPLDTPGAAQG